MSHMHIQNTHRSTAEPTTGVSRIQRKRVKVSMRRFKTHILYSSTCCEVLALQILHLCSPTHFITAHAVCYHLFRDISLATLHYTVSGNVLVFTNGNSMGWWNVERLDAGKVCCY